MSWGSIKYEYNPEERAFLLLFDYGLQAVNVQTLIIKKLSDYGIDYEYESKVLNHLINKNGFTD